MNTNKIKGGSKMRQSLKVGRNIGAVIGAIAFLAVGLVPGFYFGSYGTVVLLSHLAGGPLEGGVLVRAAVVVGTIMGIFCMASVSIVVGALGGTAVGYVTDLLTAPAPEAETAKAVAEK
jgi:hypothetical protein